MVNDVVPEVPLLKRAKRVLPPSWGPLLLVLACYGGMAIVLFTHSVLAAVNGELSLVDGDDILTRLKWDTLVFDALDFGLVLIALAFAGRPRRHPAAWHRLGTWLCSVPGFAFFLGINLAYSLTLRELFRDYLPKDQELVTLGLDREAWWAIALICIQPAIVEELFFRYLLLGHLRSHMGLNGAVWVTAVLFGMAHLGNVGGWPVLILVGAGLGYARVLSGGMALPMLLHFFHNLAVLAVESEMKP